MKFVSFNTNSIRMRQHQLEKLMADENPDVIGIQETKCQDKDFPLDNMQALSLHAEYFGQKTHYGVALLSKQTPLSVQKGYPSDDEDAQRRFIHADYLLENGTTVSVLNGYFPQGESQDHELKFPAKRKFYADLMRYLNDNFTPDDHVIVMGDMNISPEDSDIGIGADNMKRWLRTGKCSFLPEEREWMQSLKDWGLTDTFRDKNPDISDQYSWFDYRSKGFDREPKRGLRIDLIMVTKPLLAHCSAVGICHDLRSMIKPSDHCPIWAEFDL